MTGYMFAWWVHGLLTGIWVGMVLLLLLMAPPKKR